MAKLAVFLWISVALGCAAAKSHAQEPNLSDFLGSICINVHLSQGQSPAAVAAMLNASGLKAAVIFQSSQLEDAGQTQGGITYRGRFAAPATRINTG